ncbi:alpha/beta-hydrolase family protein [Pilimelia columellifera subsp. columellifera]|uniref:Alpha/beta-hydrolase family protein n=2 Tax=Pilimelia TaxID=53370 RepID=A0ABN3N5V3_9ACTN
MAEPGDPKTDDAPADQSAGTSRRRWPRSLRYDLVGLAFAATFFCLSVTPSLLPRGPLLQGLISGIAAAIGYGVGLLLLWAIRRLSGRDLAREHSRRAWAALGTVGGLAILVFLALGSGWQREVHQLVQLDPPERASFTLVLLLAALMFAGLVGLGRLIRRTAHWLGRHLGRWIPAPAARLTSVVVTAALAFGLLNGVLIDGFFSAADNAFGAVNEETEPGVAAPPEPTRSGGPESLVAWKSLGNQGRTFVAGGPTQSQLQTFGGAPPKAPIRVYTGLDSAPTASERAALAVRELTRTGAFTRRVLCVITTTGTGWVNSLGVDPLEYLYNGDTALVGMQYSYLPSWISFLVDKERARDAGRELFHQVYAVWSKLPPGQRPKLLVFGESLGSFGAESAFGSSDDMSVRTDGMLLVGPPERNTLKEEFADGRDPGTTEILPTYEQGATVRFARVPGDLDQPAGAWGPTRVVYLQHPSDPIVWWGPGLMLRQPDWLTEPRGVDVSPSMRWYPFVTFWQVSADMAFSTGVPDGFGHNYGTASAEAWTRIAPPPGWTPQRTAALVAVIG